jgi:ABC-type transport auxiliary lipoprotein component
MVRRPLSGDGDSGILQGRRIRMPIGARSLLEQARLSRILAQELSSRMPDSRVALYPCYNDHVPDFQIIVDVHRFDATVQGLARLEASWIIRDAKTNTSLYSTSSAFTQSEQNDQLRQLARVNERSNSVPRPRVLLDPRSSVVSSPAMVVYSSASPASCVIVSSPGLGKITI